MQDVLELLFAIKTSDDGGLERVNEAIKRIASGSGYTGEAVKIFEQEVKQAFDKMSAAGLNFEQIIRRLAQSQNTIGKGAAASAREYAKELQDAANAASNLEKRQKALQQASSGLKGAISDPLSALGSGVSGGLAKLGLIGVGLDVILHAAKLATTGLFEFYDSAAQAAQQTQNMALKLGISSGAMKELQVEAKIAGINIQSITMASRFLAVGLEDSTGAGKRTASALKELGISMQSATGAVREDGDVLNEVIPRLAAVTSQTKRLQLETELFGARGAREIQVLIDRYGDLKKAADELGAGSTTELIDTLTKGAEQINKMSEAWDIFKKKLALKLDPIVLPFVMRLTAGVNGPTKGTTPAEEQEQGAYGAVAKDQPAWLRTLLAGVQPTLKLSGQQIAKANPESDLLGLTDTAGGLAALAQRNAADLAGGKSITDRFNAAQKSTDEGRKAQIEANTVELKKLNDTLAKGGLNTETAANATKRIADLEAQNASIKAAEERAHQADSERRHLTEDSKFPLLSSPIEFQKLIGERQKSLDIVGKGSESLVDDKYLPKIQEAISKFFAKIAASVQKDAEKTVKDEDRHSPFDEQNIAFKKYLKDQVQISEALLGESQKQLRIINSGDRDDSKRQQARAVQLASVDGGGGGLSAINRGTVARENDATGLRADSLRQVKELEDGINDSIKAEGERSVDDEKQLASLSTRRLEIEEEYWKEIGDARLDQELKIAELQKKQLESYKREGEEIFSALQRPNGLRDFFKGQANQLFSGLFSNATAPILQKVGQSLGGLVPGQTDADGKKTGVGKLVSGTILDSDRAASPQTKATDLNTRAIDLNTQASNNLRQVLAGTTAPASGSPADGVSQLVSSSPATAGSPAQALQTLAGGQGSVAPAGSPAAALTQIASPTSNPASWLGPLPSAPTPAGGAAPNLLSTLIGAGGAGALLGGGIGSLVTSAQRATQHSESYSVPTGGGAYTPVKGGSAGSGASPQLLSLLAGGGSVGLTAALGVASSISKASAGSASPSPLAPSGRVSANDPLLFANLPSAPKYTGPPTGLAGLLSGVSSTGQSGNFGEIFHGGAPTFNPATGEDGTTPTFSTSQRVGAAVGDAAVAGTGAYEAYKQFSKGGASGVLGGIGASAGTAAILDPEPISKSILGAISAGSELIKAILPDPKTIRQADIANQTQYNAYVAPPTLNRQLSSGGDETYTNKYGQVQVSPYSSIQETQPYKYQSPVKDPNGLLANWETQPGQIIEPYQSATPEPSYATAYAPNLMAPYTAPPPTPVSTSGYGQQGGGTMSITINALDSQSVLDRSSDIATAVQREVRNGHPVGLALQQSLVGT